MGRVFIDSTNFGAEQNTQNLFLFKDNFRTVYLALRCGDFTNIQVPDTK